MGKTLCHSLKLSVLISLKMKKNTCLIACVKNLKVMVEIAAYCKINKMGVAFSLNTSHCFWCVCLSLCSGSLPFYVLPLENALVLHWIWFTADWKFPKSTAPF